MIDHLSGIKENDYEGRETRSVQDEGLSSSVRTYVSEYRLVCRVTRVDRLRIDDWSARIEER